MSPAPLPLEPPSRSRCISRWFTGSTAEAVAESLLSPTESLPGGAAAAAPAPAPSTAALPAAGRGGRAQLRPGQQLRPLLRSHASVQRPPAHLVLWDLQVTFCSPSEAGFGGKLDRPDTQNSLSLNAASVPRTNLLFSTMSFLSIYTKCVLCVVRE